MNRGKLLGKSFVAGSVLYLLSGAAISWAANEPDVTHACSKECPTATKNEETLKCMDQMINKMVEQNLKPQHRECFTAIENLVKVLGASGNTGSPGTSGSVPSPRSD